MLDHPSHLSSTGLSIVKMGYGHYVIIETKEPMKMIIEIPNYH